MERKRSVIQHMLQRILFSCFCITLLICSFVLSASAAILDYNDYISNVTVDGDNDLVTVDFPLNNVYFALYDYNTGSTAEAVSLSASFDLSAGHRYNLFFLFYYPTDSLSLADIPSDTVFTVDADITSRHNFFDVSLEAFYNINYFYDSQGNYVGSTSSPVSVTDHYTFTSTLPQLSSTYASFNPGLQWANWVSNYDDNLFISVNSLTMKFSISSLLRLQQTSGKTNAILKEVEQQLADQGKVLDDILSGGSGAEDLIAGGDKIENAGSGLGEDIGKIEDFEDQYMGQLEDNLDDVIAGADLTWLYPPLMFIQRYLNKIVAAIPSKYLIVFTLPMCFGLFMFIVGHPVRAPRPDTSGDQVTRETFSETTILSGPNAGRVSSTRTVTTSQEIGRIHNE